MKSVWSETAKLPKFNKLDHDISTDVLIIGGGITGILCEYMLTKAGVDCTLLEKDRICSGVTKNTTAKITSQHGFIYHKLIRDFGEEKAKMYYYANENALEKYRELSKNIDCDFQEKDNYVFCTDAERKVDKEMNALHKLNIKGEFCDNLPLPIDMDIIGAIRFRNQAQFNVLKFISEISKDLNIFEETEVNELVGMTALTNKGKVKAKKIIVATHYPFINKHGSYYLKLYQHRSYVIALDNAESLDGMYVDESNTGMSFRNYGELLLLGGGDHRTGKHGGNYDELEAFARANYPKAKEKYRWATQDCMSLDSVPYIGQYSKNTPKLYVATGFNKWGMTTSMVAATILTDMITGKDNPYAPVFSPSRTILRPQLAINAFEAVTNLLTPTKPRCPHLGCALKWNKAERSWDCPCHGSRFSHDGKVLDNPATGNLK